MLSDAIIYCWENVVKLLLARNDIAVNAKEDDVGTPSSHAVGKRRGIR